MNNLKERLAPLKLTAEQRANMLIQREKPKKTFRFVPIVVPAFVALALLMIVLTVMPSDGTTVNGASKLVQLQPLPIRHIVLTAISTVLMVVVYVLMRMAIPETKRWRSNAFVQELHVLLLKLPLVVFVMVVLTAAMWFGAFYFNSKWYVEGLYMFWVYWLLLFGFLKSIRDFDYATCPHCGVRFTPRQIIVKLAFQYRERCKDCKHLVYVSKRSKMNVIIMFLWPTMPLWLGNFLSVHESLIIACSLLSLIPFLTLYAPAMAEFTAEDEDPEKFA